MNKSRRAFITGISGFVGGHLTDFLARESWKVYGFDIKVPRGHVDGFWQGELSNRASLLQALREAEPDVIFHLAGVLKTEQIESFYISHVLGTLSVFEAILESGLRPRVLIASSSAVYGEGIGKRAITEQFKPRPMTHYAASKQAEEIAALRYFAAYNMAVVCIRTFNLIGPGLSPELACSDFAQQIARAENESKPAKIQTGKLETYRDFVDVRDAVRAYELIARRGRAGETYNVCSEKAVTMLECLNFLSKQARVPVEIALDPTRLQKHDVPFQMGSARRLRELGGWKPRFPLKQSLTDLLNNWRQQVNTEPGC